MSEVGVPARSRVEGRRAAVVTVLVATAVLFVAAEVWSIRQAQQNPDWADLAIIAFTAVNGVAFAVVGVIGLTIAWLVVTRRSRAGTPVGTGGAVVVGMIGVAVGVVPLVLLVTQPWA